MSANSSIMSTSLSPPTTAIKYPHAHWLSAHSKIKQLEQSTASRHPHAQQQQGKEAIRDGSSKWRAWQQSRCREGHHLPEESLHLLKHPASPGRLRNCSGKHSSPANRIRGPMRPSTNKRVHARWCCWNEQHVSVWILKCPHNRSGRSDLFGVTFILFAQGFEKLQIHFWLCRSGLGFALVAARCSCWGALNFDRGFCGIKTFEGVRQAQKWAVVEDSLTKISYMILHNTPPTTHRHRISNMSYMYYTHV